MALAIISFDGYGPSDKMCHQFPTMINKSYLAKSGARRPQAGVDLVSRNYFRAAKVCVCVCVHPQGYK